MGDRLMEPTEEPPGESTDGDRREFRRYFETFIHMLKYYFIDIKVLANFQHHLKLVSAIAMTVNDHFTTENVGDGFEA